MGIGKKQTVGYRYNAGMHMVLCHGPIDKLTRIRVDERIAWEGESTGGAINIDADSLFGGDSREGGIKGQVDFETGHAAQAPNSYLVSKLGAMVPAFRGVASLILRQVYLGMNPYLKKWDCRAQRIDVRQDGLPQWHPEKAKIPIRATEYNDAIVRPSRMYFSGKFMKWDGDEETYVSSYLGLSGAGPYLWNQDAFGSLGFYGGGVSNPLMDEIYFTWFIEDFDAVGYIEFEMNISAGTTSVPEGDISFSFGNEINVVDISREVVAVGVSGSVYKYTLKLVFLAKAPITITAKSRFDRNYIGSQQFFFSCFVYKITAPISWPWLIDQFDMNPAHIIRECLTDPLWGMGYLDADIDNTSFQAAADTLYTEEFGMSLLWDTETSIEEFVKIIVKHIDASIYVDRKTGKFILKLIRNDYDPANLLTLDESNIEKITDFKRPSIGELVSSVTVTYWSNETGESATLTVQDIALSHQQQSTVGISTTYEGITNPYIASRVAQRDLETLSTPLASCTVYANRVAANLNVGGVFKLTWPGYGLTNVVMRVTGIAYGDGRSHRVRIQCVQDVFAMPDSAVIVPPPTEWQDTGQEPIPITRYTVFEVPYFELVQQQGQQAADALLAGNPDMGFVGAGAARPQSAALSARIYTDMGNGYTDASNFDFSPCAVLDEAIDQMATTFAIRDVQDIENITLGTWFQLGTELMSVESITPSGITVKRGVLDTVPVPHADGDSLIFWDVYGEADPTEYIASEQIDVKLLTVTGSGRLALADAPQDTVTLDSRAFRPYPPGNFKVNGEYFPTLIASETLDLTWVGRNRLQQTGGVLIGFDDSNIDPEDGTTYTIRVYDAGDDSLILEEADITDDFFSTSAAAFPTYVRIMLWAVRDGYESYQPQVANVILQTGIAELIFEDGYTPDDGDDVVLQFTE